MQTTVQLAMTRPDWFHPVLGGSDHYVPALQALPGELAALEHASSETWAHLTPLIQARGPRTPRTVPFRDEAVKGWCKKMGAAVQERPCFLDTLRLAPTHPTTTNAGEFPLLSVFHDAARKRGLKFVPVLKLNSKRPEVNIVRESCLFDGRGVAIRYCPQKLALPAGQILKDLIEAKLAEVEVDPTGSDLFIDLGFLSEDTDVAAEDIAILVNDLTTIGEWRSVVLLGTSMPSSLGGGVVQEGTIGRLPRREWDLWSALRASGVPRLPTFGDYAVQLI